MYDSNPKELKKEGKQRVKEGVKANNEKPAKEARLSSRADYQEAKRAERSAVKEYKLYDGEHPTARALYFKKELDRARLEKKVTRKVYTKAKKNDASYIPNRLKRRAKQGARAKIQQEAEGGLQDNDILSEWVKARQNIRQLHYQKAASKRALQAAGRLSKYVIKHNYEQANRTYNFIRGRGFTRTPRDYSWEGRLSKKIRGAKQRFARTRIGRVSRGTGKVLKVASKPFRSILANPLAIKSYFLIFLIFGIGALFMGIFGGSAPIQQNEFDLNRSWLLLSKRDREKSDDKVDYWTNIDEVLFYMNFRYGSEWSPDSAWKEGTGGELAATLGFNHYSDALNDVWNGLNQDPQKLKTMADLYGEKSEIDWMKFSKNDLEDFKEVEELTKEVGRYPNYQELDNFLYSPDDASYTSPLVIIKRYGYTSTDKTYDGSLFQATNGQKLYAAMDGEVEVKDTDFLIKSKEAILTYKNVEGIRYKTGDLIKTGEEIGQVKSSNGQELYYQKLKEKETKEEKAKWTYVNPGFYFTSVKYTQTTSVLSDLKLSGDLAQRVQQLKALIKQKVPEATDNGLAAVFGNFITESNLTSKRAESDYVNPPVGATASSWDDENWLNMGYADGASIGEKVIHRGLGLGMWTDTTDGSVRNTLLRNFAKDKGKKWYDLELQFEFMLEGDNPYYINILKSILTSNDSVDSLTTRFLANWEGVPGDKLAQRIDNAKQVLVYLQQGGGAIGVPTDGDYAHPFNTPYTVLQPYGFTPWSTGGGAALYASSGGKHTGVDIQANNVSDIADTPIFSMTDGKVYSVSYSALGGHAITIQPDFGGYLYYGHLKYAPNLSAGDTVRKGQQIAVLGHSGLTDIYHIHLEYSSNPSMATGLYDKDPSFLFQKSGTLQQNQVINPK